MLKQLIGWLTGAPAEQIGEYFRERQRLKQEIKLTKLEGQKEVARAKAEAKAEQARHLASWEMAQITNSGWKDEFVLLTISYPVYGSFIPYLQENVSRGFEILGTTPYWYMAIVITIYLAVYGVRWKYASQIELKKK